MLHTLQQLTGHAVMERTTLVINHVLASEPVALQRLRPHAGRCIQVELRNWPKLLPPVPPIVFVVTPPGLVEWIADEPAPAADLKVTLDSSNPAALLLRSLSGQRPPVDVSGDARLATDVSWLMDNLRWDFQDDLAKLAGPAVANELGRVANLLARGLREGAAALRALAARARGDGSGDEHGPGPGQPAR